MPPSRPSHFVLAAALAALSLASCKPQAAADPRLADRLVQVATAEPAPGARHSFTGVVAAKVQSDLGFRVQGKIVERLVDTGMVVKQGQPLMRIDPTDYVHAITVQSGDVAAARARWVQAAADEKRFRSLVGSGAVAQTTYDQAKAAVDSAEATLSAAEAQEEGRAQPGRLCRAAGRCGRHDRRDSGRAGPGRRRRPDRHQAGPCRPARSLGRPARGAAAGYRRDGRSQPLWRHGPRGGPASPAFRRRRPAHPDL